MTTTVHYISQTAPGQGQVLKTTTNGQEQPTGATPNINDGTLTSTSPSTDAVGIWWTDTGVLATRTTRKQLLMALENIKRFIIRGGWRTSGAAGQDPNIPT